MMSFIKLTVRLTLKLKLTFLLFYIKTRVELHLHSRMQSGSPGLEFVRGNLLISGSSNLSGMYVWALHIGYIQADWSHHGLKTSLLEQITENFIL